MRRWNLLIVLVVVVAGCHTPTARDPNDPFAQGANQAELLRKNLQWASDAANARVQDGEITRLQAKDLVRQYAAGLASLLGNTPVIQPASAWMYGELFITAHKWGLAKQALELAVKSARNDDRLVNDSLSLAEADAQMGLVDEAIRLCRSTFSVPPTAKAPILPGVLLRVVPAAEGKGQDVGLAQTLEGAIEQHEQTIVNPKDPAGKAFFIARPYHIRNAWRAVIRLYGQAGRADLAQAAAAKASAEKLVPGSV